MSDTKIPFHVEASLSGIEKAEDVLHPKPDGEKKSEQEFEAEFEREVEEQPKNETLEAMKKHD